MMIPEFKKITNHLNDAKIAITSNKIKNCFPKKLPKKTSKNCSNQKKNSKRRFDLKLMYLDEDNAIF